MDGDNLSDFLEEHEFGGASFAGAASPDDIFGILEALESMTEFNPLAEKGSGSKNGTSSSVYLLESEPERETAGSLPKRKRQKVNAEEEGNGGGGAGSGDGQQKCSHITVERNRRRQMNEHLSVLRSIMPSFYVKRGDQASIIGGVVNYINELQQILQSLEAKKQRKIYNEVLSPRVFASSPRPSPLSPRKPPLSPRISLPISPRTPQPTSPYKPRLNQGYLSSPTMVTSLEPSPSSSASSSIDNGCNDLVANSKSALAEVEVKFNGPNLVLKTISPRIPGQVVKVISALDELSLEILHLNIGCVEETMFNSFTIKIGIECKLSAEELAHQIQQTFC